MPRYDERLELAPRDVVARSIQAEMRVSFFLAAQKSIACACVPDCGAGVQAGGWRCLLFTSVHCLKGVPG